MNKFITHTATGLALSAPFIITARLMPGLAIGGAIVSIDDNGRNRDGRTCYQIWIDLPDGGEHEITDLCSGCQGGDLQEGMGSLLAFLGAAIESRRYRERQGKPYDANDGDSSESLFPPAVVDWASENADEISALQYELEEGEHD
jgi:hypothetical protein